MDDPIVPDNTSISSPSETSQVPVFNEHERWNEIQVKLASQDENLKARMQASDGQTGIVSDSYERRMREIRQKLYDDFIKKNLDYQVERLITAGGATHKVEALQIILQQHSVLTVQAGKDKVFRDDLVKEVEHRLDTLSSNPFQASEEKLQALASIYDHAVRSGAEQGGVTENWRKRILREARRKYALSLAKAPSSQVEKWTQGTTDLAKYLKGLLAKEDIPSEETHTAISPSVPASAEPRVAEEPRAAAIEEKEEQPTPAPVSPFGSPPSSPETTQSSPQSYMPTPNISEPEDNEPETTQREEEESDLLSVTADSTKEEESVKEDSLPTPAEVTPESVSVEQTVTVSETTTVTPQPPVQPTPTTPFHQVGTVIPAPTPSEEKEEVSIPTPTTPTTPQQDVSSAPGQSFTDFLNSRRNQPESVTTPEPTEEVPSRPTFSDLIQAQPQKTQTHASQEPSSEPIQEQNPISSPWENPASSTEETQQPEKKKGFLSKLFGR